MFLTLNVNFFAELSVSRLYEILKLRQDVFLLEQSCLYADLDDLDQKALHILLISEEDDNLLAYCRILPAGTKFSDVSIGRLAVSDNERKKGYAKQVMQKAIDFIAEEMQASKVKISAQYYLYSFYESFGFKAVSEPFDEDGIKHIEMELTNMDAISYNSHHESGL
ncbi:GNAT family N-acetyltransferase [Psychromonas sp.]|nr:GNAT family N-acetyltransferase [Psychromonas sp.]